MSRKRPLPGTSKDTEQLFTGQGKTVTHFVNKLLENLQNGIKAAEELPCGDDYRFQQAFRAFPKEMNQFAGAFLQLIHKTTQKAARQPVDVASITDDHRRMDAVANAVESILEKVDGAFDAATGKTPKKYVTSMSSANVHGAEAGDKSEGSDNGEVDVVLHRGNQRLTGRPQLRFNPPPDNSAHPFRVKIYHPETNQVSFGEPGVHLYADQIKNFQCTPEQLAPVKEQLYAPLEETEVIWVDTPSKLRKMISVLAGESEIAVDLEAHQYRSFQGFCCLAQISTRQMDYLVDVLELHDHFHLMNPIFTNPQITKVMHGAHHDVEWLQRDFGIYVVNLFDTSCAAKLLEFPSLGLAFLLNYFCQTGMDAAEKKKFQTADWRVRPLPLEMVQYARGDTHYLLYIYDRLRLLLRQRSLAVAGSSDLVQESFEMSKALCLRQYVKDIFDETSFFNFLDRHQPFLTKQKAAVLRSVLEWRNAVARSEDESIAYVLPSAAAINIALNLPRTTRDLLACVNPVPRLLRLNASDVLGRVQAALSACPDESIFTYGTSTEPSSQLQSKVGLENAEIEVEETETVERPSSAAMASATSAFIGPMTKGATLQDALATFGWTPQPASGGDTQAPVLSSFAKAANYNPMASSGQEKNNDSGTSASSSSSSLLSSVFSSFAPPVPTTGGMSGGLLSSLGDASSNGSSLFASSFSTVGSGDSATMAPSLDFSRFFNSIAASSSAAPSTIDADPRSSASSSFLPSYLTTPGRSLRANSTLSDHDGVIITGDNSGVSQVSRLLGDAPQPLSPSAPVKPESVKAKTTSDGIPKSLEQIYGHSSCIKAKQKQSAERAKKKKRQNISDEKAVQSNIGSEVALSSSSSASSQGGKSNSKDRSSAGSSSNSPIEFMTSIGWVDPSARPGGGEDDSVGRIRSPPKGTAMSLEDLETKVSKLEKGNAGSFSDAKKRPPPAFQPFDYSRATPFCARPGVSPMDGQVMLDIDALVHSKRETKRPTEMMMKNLVSKKKEKF